MIKKLNTKSEEACLEIRSLFQLSYAVEAALLNARNFPPLKRKLVDFAESDTTFYGFCKGDEVVGIVEVRPGDGNTHIQSLVVHPDHFRQGIGKQLMQFVFRKFVSDTYMVETGVDNGPATLLYKNMGFEEVAQWDTEIGIRKVRFIKSNQKDL